MRESNPYRGNTGAPGTTGAPGIAGPPGTGAAIAAPRYSLKWIVSPRVDIPCFLCAASLGYGMFYLHAGLGMNMVTVWFIWYMFLDSPHFFGTYSRTYLDKEEMKGRRRLLLGSIGLLGVGPLIVGICWIAWQSGAEWYKTPYLVLVGFVSMWAYWHVVRQHWGIMALYKRKNEEPSMFERRFDQWTLYLTLMAPLAGFVVTNSGARAALGFSSEVPGSDIANPRFTNPYVPGGWETYVLNATAAIAIGALVVFLGRQLYLRSRGRTVNVAKILFLLAVAPLHFLVCWHPESSTIHLLGFGASVTIFHDVQYHAIVWYYQKNRMAKAGETAEQRYGFAAKIGRSFPLYVVCAVGMGLTLGLLGCVFQVNPGCIPVLASRDIALFDRISLEELLYGIFLGVLMHHYFVDQFIWRPSKDANVQKGLKLDKSAEELPAH